MQPNDITNYPDHMIGHSIEPIVVIEVWGFEHHLACAVKYIARVGRKNPIAEDLKKAEWYITRFIRQADLNSQVSSTYRLTEFSKHSLQAICKDWQLSENLSKCLSKLTLFKDSTSLFLKEEALKGALKYLRDEIALWGHDGQPMSQRMQPFEEMQRTSNFIPYKEVERQLKDRIYELATSILGYPNKGSERTNFLRFGKKGEISVGIRGDHLGVYTNFEKNVNGSPLKGGPLKLIEDQMGLSSFQETLRWASEWLGVQDLTRQVEQKKPSTWVPMVPVPDYVAEPDIAHNSYLNRILNGGNTEVSRHAYRDEQGNLKGYVFRFEKPNPNDPAGKKLKITPPLAYCRNEHGLQFWRWTAFERENKTPYGIEKLSHDLKKPILIVEGEKTCDAAQKLLPEYHVLTWSGGKGGIGKTSWECLIGKEVLIWPDYDYDFGGQLTAQKLRHIITQLNYTAGQEGRVGIVKLPPYSPEKPALLPDAWDLADPLPEGWTFQTIIKCLNSTVHNVSQNNIHDDSIAGGLP